MAQARQHLPHPPANQSQKGQDHLEDPLQDPLAEEAHRGSVHQQLPEKGKLNALYDQALDALEPFTALVNELKESTGAVLEVQALKPYDRKKWKEEHPDEKPDLHKGKYVKVPKAASGMGPLKDPDRVKQKAKDDYQGDVSKVLDVVRASLTYADCAGMIGALKAIQQRDDVQIRRIKNKLDAKGRGALGYGDITLNLEIEGHVCELQLQHKAMLAIKPALHDHYGDFRDLGQGKGIKDVPQGKEQGQMQKDVHASQDLANDAIKEVEHDPDFRNLMKLVAELGG